VRTTWMRYLSDIPLISNASQVPVVDSARILGVALLATRACVQCLASTKLKPITIVDLLVKEFTLRLSTLGTLLKLKIY
jgi:hypothetical protein